MANPKQTQAPRIEKAGWDVSSWCRSVGISRTKFYALEGDMRPRDVRLGSRRIVAETPKEWLGRIAAAQEGGTR